METSAFLSIPGFHAGKYTGKFWENTCLQKEKAEKY